MVSSEEISKRLQLLRNGLDPDTGLEKLSEMQRPFEWVEGSCIIDFDSWPVDDLSITIKDLFEDADYHLEEGTPIEGIYGRGNAFSRLFIGYLAFRYRFKIEIYSDNEKTFIKISKAISNWSVVFIDGPVYGNAFYNDTFKRIIDVLKYLKPNYDGYMFCEKCGGYYKLQTGESPEDFDVCQCGGQLKYYPSSKPYIKENPKTNSSSNTITLLIPVITLLILCGVGIMLIFWDNPMKGIYIVILTILALTFTAIYTIYYFIKSIIKN